MRNNINGILLLDKSLDMTSNRALQRVKYLFAAKKAGHTGSLDPLATGMLPICFGEATKFSQFLLESDKVYQVVMKLGVKTTTADAEGEVISTRPIVGITPDRVEKIVQQFIGPIQQIPPMHSAVKYQGKPLYKLARQGLAVERKPRSVYIHDLKLEQLTEDTISLYVHCSKGTYVRTLVEDIGEQLGCGAHVAFLRRSVVVPYLHEKMYTLEALEAIYKEGGVAGLQLYLLPVETSVQRLPSLTFSNTELVHLRRGQAVQSPHSLAPGFVRIFSEEAHFIGIGEIIDDGRISPRRLLSLPLHPATIAGHFN